MQQDTNSQPYLRPAEAAVFIRLGISTLWDKAKHDATFPKGIRLSSKATVFRRDELIAWVESKAVKEAA